MSSPATPNATDAQQSRAYAAWYGFWVGCMWVLSFALAMWGLTSPMASNLAVVVGLMSLPLAVWLLRGFREMVAPLPLRRAWHMAWMLFLGAALLLTAAQFVYFTYLDGGRMAAAYTELVAQPEMHDLLQRILPGQDVDTLVNEAINAFMTTPPAQLALQFLFWNVLIATFFAFPVALFSFTRNHIKAV